MNVGKLNKRIEIWRNQPFENELLEADIKPMLFKTVWASIVPQTGSIQKAQVETIMTNVTSKIIVRYESGKELLDSDFIVFKGKRFDIKFILNPYEANKTLEIFSEQKSG